MNDDALIMIVSPIKVKKSSVKKIKQSKNDKEEYWSFRQKQLLGFQNIPTREEKKINWNWLSLMQESYGKPKWIISTFMSVETLLLP